MSDCMAMGFVNQGAGQSTELVSRYYYEKSFVSQLETAYSILGN